ncbi:MAG: hypothetical protein EOP76_18850 [Variovorax sp.]|nr:MAG: hypothetical protein EOP76_18850 [Variovorax sp.]
MGSATAGTPVAKARASGRLDAARDRRGERRQKGHHEAGTVQRRAWNRKAAVDADLDCAVGPQEARALAQVGQEHRLL